MGGDHLPLGLGQGRGADHDRLDELQQGRVAFGVAQEDVGDALKSFAELRYDMCILLFFIAIDMKLAKKILPDR